LAEWGRRLTARAAVIEAGQRAVRIIRLALGSIGAVAADATGTARGSVVDRGGADLDLPGAYAALDRFVLMPAAEVATDDRRLAAAILESLTLRDLVQVLRAMASAGHDVRGAARLGDVIAESGVDLGELVAGFADALGERDPFVAALVGHAVIRRPSDQIGREILPGLLDVPGRLATVIWGAAIGTERSQAGGGLDHLVASISQSGDATMAAEAAAELMRATLEPYGAVWRAELDRTIASIIGGDASGVLGELGFTVDPDGDAMVPWVRRLFGEPEGPRHLGAITAGLVGEGPVAAQWLAATGDAGEFTGAITAGYLNGVVTVATRLVAANAHDTVAAMGRIAAVVEALAAIGTKMVAVVDSLLPGSVDLGLDAASDSADGRIEAAMWDVLEAIDERFEPDRDHGVAGLGDALLALDDRRDELVRVWFP
jgi:hypothetical protein